MSSFNINTHYSHLWQNTPRFLAEQYGSVENEFKLELCRVFEKYANKIRCYLTRVGYKDGEGFNVALCLRTGTDDFEKLTNDIAEIFRKMFGSNEHLDIIFLTEKQEAEIRPVCCPFFNSRNYQPEKADFYLTSSEGYGIEEIRECFKVRRLLGNHPDDYMLCDITPPIIGQRFGLGANDIKQVILASRYSGYSIFPVREWPAHVHVAYPLNDLSKIFSISETDLKLIGWGELFNTRPAVA